MSQSPGVACASGGAVASLPERQADAHARNADAGREGFERLLAGGHEVRKERAASVRKPIDEVAEPLDVTVAPMVVALPVGLSCPAGLPDIESPSAGSPPGPSFARGPEKHAVPERIAASVSLTAGARADSALQAPFDKPGVKSIERSHFAAPTKIDVPSGVAAPARQAPGVAVEQSVTLMLGLPASPLVESKRGAGRAIGSESTSNVSLSSVGSPLNASALGGPLPTLHETAGTESLSQALRSRVMSYELSLKTDGWESNLSNHVEKMLKTDNLQTVIRVSPEHLGSIEISIQVKEGEVHVDFGAHVGETRAALENAIPKLRELLQLEGLKLSQVSVSNLAGRDARPVAGAAGLLAGFSPTRDRLPEARLNEAPARPSRSKRDSLDEFV